jgi:tripartite motif-containing protein 71
MKRIILITVTAAVMTMTCCESPTEPVSGWVYGGEMYDCRPGTGKWHSLAMSLGVAVVPQTGIVYVAVSYETWRVHPPTDVQYFTANGRYVGTWVGDRNAEFLDVATSPSRNRVYVADRPNHRVLYYTVQGSLVGEWAVSGAPVSIAVSPADGNVYVDAHHSIQYFTADGSYLGAWGEEGSGNGQFRSPYGVAVAPDTGYVYVADTFNNRVQYFTATGSFLGKWGAPGSGDGAFKEPTGVAVSPADGNVYTVDRGNNRVQYFTSDGSFVGTLGSYGSGNGQFYLPWALCFNGTGNRLYVTESPFARVQYFVYYP